MTTREFHDSRCHFSAVGDLVNIELIVSSIFHFGLHDYAHRHLSFSLAYPLRPGHQPVFVDINFERCENGNTDKI